MISNKTKKYNCFTVVWRKTVKGVGTRSEYVSWSVKLCQIIILIGLKKKNYENNLISNRTSRYIMDSQNSQRWSYTDRKGFQGCWNRNLQGRKIQPWVTLNIQAKKYYFFLCPKICGALIGGGEPSRLFLPLSCT